MFEFIVLGCGSSGGVPRIDGDWGGCDSANPKNFRTRCSLLVRRIAAAQNSTDDNKRTEVLIDTAPDMRQQLIAARARWLDGVLYSHDHADQTHGIDDLRALVYARRQRIDVWMDTSTAQTLTKRFGYCFAQLAGSDYPSILNLNKVENNVPIAIEGAGGAIVAHPFRQIHGKIDSIGYRIGNLAYSSDISDIPDESAAMLMDLDVWIVDALRRTPHPTHFHLAKTLQKIAQFKPKKAILTNLHIDMDYETLRQELPPNIAPAYDGMKITLPQNDDVA